MTAPIIVRISGRRGGMDVLVVNCGSSSLRAAVLDAEDGVRRVEVLAERIGEPDSVARIDASEQRELAARDHAAALTELLPEILEMMRARKDDLGMLVTHEFTVDRIEEALTLAGNPDQAQKVCIAF